MLQSVGSQRVGHNSVTEQQHNCFTVLFSVVQRTESAVCVHISPPPRMILPAGVVKNHQIRKDCGHC